jgi:NitT/TauT family transport system permease protein
MGLLYMPLCPVEHAHGHQQKQAGLMKTVPTGIPLATTEEEKKKTMRQFAPSQRPRKLKDFSEGPRNIRNIMMIGSILGGILGWYLLSRHAIIGIILAGPDDVISRALVEEWNSGRLRSNILMSLWRVLGGWTLAFMAAVPVAFMMGWYAKFKNIVDPWLQFMRTIPPIALIPLVILFMGIGEEAKLTVIFVAAFLVMVVTIYQGVRNIDLTLVKAAYTFGASDFDIFFRVIVPASFPFILVASRLGISTGLTTLIAAELTGTIYGLGNMIQEAQLYFRMDKVMLGIICIGVIGFFLDRMILLLEKKLTRWQ